VSRENDLDLGIRYVATEGPVMLLSQKKLYNKSSIFYYKQVMNNIINHSKCIQ
jgi:hypothetical protein